MSDSERKWSYSLLFIPIIALTILFAPSPACSDSILMLHSDEAIMPMPEAGRDASKRPVTVGLNENGDLMLQHRDVTLVVAYNPANDILDQQEQVRIARRQECPPISGISLKVSFLF